MVKKIGFACKFSELDKAGKVVSIPELNTRTTTIAWLKRQDKTVAEERLWDIVKHNIRSLYLVLERLSNVEDDLKFFRLSSDILPAYTEPNWRYFYRISSVRRYCEQEFRKVGDLARANSIRLSFHPGQFCVLASDNPDVVERSIEEFEYHADMARWMGYGVSFQDFKINVHISGRAGPEGIRLAYKKLTPEARNAITIENEEISWGLDSCLELADLLPIVLDVHHHWCREGEYIQPSDDRVKRVIDSWRGVRPVLHYSVSREDLLVDHDVNTLPDMSALLAVGHKKQKLRAHSDFYWNDAVNLWALTFSDYADIMCESKSKNLASFKLFEFRKNLNI